ncbi:MAG: Hsp20/alpha crystallin family protein [Thermodesulfobacteriota bacterium]|nr:Hsp20/alpha crystallin family protein [Thermodesulfobacteriota bacterium]
MNALTPSIWRNNWLKRHENTQGDLFDRLFEDFGMPALTNREASWVPAIDVSETDNEYLVKAELPGLKKEDIDISLNNGILTLKGEKKQEKKDDNENYHFRESYFGTFTRSLRLPNDASEEKVDATYHDGVVTVSVPKSEKAKPKKIKIN